MSQNLPWVPHVDAATVIYGGRNENTFALGSGASFSGEIIGGVGLKPPSAVFQQGLLAANQLVSGPVTANLLVNNTIKFTERAGVIKDLLTLNKLKSATEEGGLYTIASLSDLLSPSIDRMGFDIDNAFDYVSLAVMFDINDERGFIVE